MGTDGSCGLAKIGLVVGPEIQAGPLPRCCRGGAEEFVRHDAFLMVAPLGPRIGEKDEYRGETGAFRDGRQEVFGVGPDKMQVWEARPLVLADGPRNPVGRNVDSDAVFFRVRRGISHKEMAVATSNLPYEAGGGRDDLEQRSSQRFASRRDARRVVQYPRGSQAAESVSFWASIATMRRLMSVGLTPLIRLAWPSVRGFI